MISRILVYPLGNVSTHGVLMDIQAGGSVAGKILHIPYLTNGDVQDDDTC